ncbi:Nuclear transcription factor Y subunit B-1 [Rhodotorula toruloides ATCC 204091]|uniref:Nuclear transcription factor Y subunit B-1 n=1 Tax=Rhodotorula toruloides TaxID=5286 RepID=A0A0K3C9B9_RHOTO|nr:Nuclear transcription factor Y subunit B-1 [Rhodotorula toruloides ATCC 204091]KAK4335028.1 Transcriptional activator HAP3 [Rhodotorula toruloides]PRQ76444.1 nuclear transcription factor Y subunit B-1 [Rhodotorula toruloides]
MNYYDPNAGSLPALRPAALDAEAGVEGRQAGAEGTVAAPRKIEEHEVETYKEQDRYLPIANVGRIMKKCLPETTKVSKDAKECVQECTSEFISFITSEAAERCLVEKRKTINGEDILFAMATLGFDSYAEVLKVYLAKYREQQRASGKRAQKRAAKEAAAAAASTSAAQPAPSVEAAAVDYDDDFGGLAESGEDGL